jgi:DNA anti-recombination protein RmuC
MLKAIYDSFRRLDEKVTKLEKNINNANNLVKAVSSRAKSIIAEVDSELTIKKESYTEVANED